MTLPSAFNPISLGQIQTEFGGANPIRISEYYRNGVYTTSNNTNVPTGPAGVRIKFSDFYGSRRAIFGCTNSSATNYNPSANQDDGSCRFIVRGCTNPSALNYNPSANQDDGSCRFCVVPSVTTEYGFGFQGYLLYSNGFRGNGGFITRTNDAYLNASPQPFTTAGGVVTTYAEVGNYIVNYYLTNLGRYPDQETFSSGISWFYEFLNVPTYTSFSALGTAIQTDFNRPIVGEGAQRAAKGGLIGNYDSCNVLRR